ncbi:hypothetical protein GUITHDRAFT_153136 [Guillardia theta CCMP2712]|uniref:Uncharacterized protein n=2 Tax=Guillardia theta TaxID=55529 RepID=L1J659_GUITC|nr:hypothetical protein GUITHDRAFT_153136 [Guillardia theta CCMP2712]EKX44028.1 hypothetical protein GUITHDRAFT_153136 [Guillardia theta CCMP2712]|eukprot:XP_005831008.1 hypothetical protein GUITHDRAFT_153136 [Guillardia theta CCMP2712]
MAAAAVAMSSPMQEVYNDFWSSLSLMPANHYYMPGSDVDAPSEQTMGTSAYPMPYRYYTSDGYPPATSGYN